MYYSHIYTRERQTICYLQGCKAQRRMYYEQFVGCTANHVSLHFPLMILHILYPPPQLYSNAQFKVIPYLCIKIINIKLHKRPSLKGSYKLSILCNTLIINFYVSKRLNSILTRTIIGAQTFNEWFGIYISTYHISINLYTHIFINFKLF